jgi:hypothetical protein
MKTKYFTPNLAALKPTLQKFAFNHPFEHELLLGWMIVSPFSGLLEWRPHLAITAEAGAGKTTLINLIHEILRPHVPLLLEGTTEAGLRQRLKYDAVPVILDEIDTNNLDPKAFYNIVKLFRLASSAGEVVKGTPSGKHLSYTACFSGLIAGINLPTFSEADATRFTVLELSKRNRTSKWSELEPDIRAVINPKTAFDLKEWMLQGEDTDQGSRPLNALMIFKMEQDIRCMTALLQDFTDSRTAQQYGTLLGGLKTYLDTDDFQNLPRIKDTELFITDNKFASEPTDTAYGLIARLKSYWKDKTPESIDGSLSDDSDAGQCLERLMAFDIGKLDPSHTQNMLLRQVIKSKEARETKNKWLGGFEMKIIKDKLFVPYANPNLEKHFKGTAWDKSWVKSLARLDGAKITAAKIDGDSKKGVVVSVTVGEESF